MKTSTTVYMAHFCQSSNPRACYLLPSQQLQAKCHAMSRDLRAPCLSARRIPEKGLTVPQQAHALLSWANYAAAKGGVLCLISRIPEEIGAVLPA